MASADEYFTRQYVVAQVQVVIREASPSVIQYRDRRKNIFETCRPSLRSCQVSFQEKVLRHVVRRPHAVEWIRAEILDAERAEVGAQLDVLRLDLRRLDGAT